MSMPPESENDHAAVTRKNARMGLMVLGVVLGMAGLAYASVPLYNLFCRVTGYGGTTQVSEALPDHILNRTVIVKFNTDTAPNMLWDFKPEQREITVKLGQKGLASFYAHNRTSSPSTGTALYNVTPLKVGKYFHKIQCFCFGEQTLEPGQSVSMPVLFYVDPAMNEDRNLDDVEVITLSYSFFNAQSKELEEATEAFYNQ